MEENIEMTCHLMEKETFTSKEELQFQKIEDFVQSDKFDLFLCKCSRCEQLYIGYFVEINLADGDDDCWNFWVPVSESEIEKIKTSPKESIDIIQSRRHITWHPDGKIYWSNMHEIALVRGPG